MEQQLLAVVLELPMLRGNILSYSRAVFGRAPVESGLQCLF